MLDKKLTKPVILRTLVSPGLEVGHGLLLHLSGVVARQLLDLLGGHAIDGGVLKRLLNPLL